MSTPQVALGFRFSLREVFDASEVPAAADESQRTLQTGQHNFSKTLTPSTTPAMTAAPIALTITLGAGTTTLDLTAITGLGLPPGARTIDLTGKKIVALQIRTKSTNAGDVTIAPGSSTPYPLYGTGKAIILGPDRHELSAFRGTASNLPAVSGSVKKIDLSGTNGDVLYLEFVAGT